MREFRYVIYATLLAILGFGLALALGVSFEALVAIAVIVPIIPLAYLLYVYGGDDR